MSAEVGGRRALFGAFELIAGQQLLLEDGKPVQIGSRALEILVVLTERPGEVVTKEELLARVWPNTFVDEGSLRVHIAALRRALRDGEGDRRMIVNIPGRGYSFVAAVRRDDGDALPAAAEAPAPPRRRTLPALLRRMIGRDETIENLSAQLLEQRFVSIVGAGGIGKTTVAVAVAHTLSRAFDDAVCFVDLGSVSDPALVATTVATALGSSATGQDALANLTAFLQGRRTLIVLDSCEHVIGGVAILAEHLFREAPLACILTTTREALRVEGENVHLLEALTVPPEQAVTSGDLHSSAAVQLFLDRASAAGHRAESTDDEIRAVAAICRRLDGIALAIELAASQASIYGIRGIAELLDQQFGLMWRGRRLALPRHQTLQAALDWSYNLLSGPEQRVLCALSVFAGSFSLDSAQAVAADGEDEGLEVVDAIARLVAKSLIQRSDQDELTRYRLLDTTRAYAANKLAELPDAATFARRHAEHFLALTSQGGESGHDRTQIPRRARELANVRAALDWACGPGGDAAIGAALTAAYIPIWTQLGLLVECSERVERALARLGPSGTADDPLRMRLTVALGATLFFTIGPDARTRRALADALALAYSLNDTSAQLQTLWVQWGLQINAGECLAAQASAEEFARIAGQTGDPNDALFAQRLMANVLTFRGDHAQARSALENVLARFTMTSPVLRNVPMTQDIRLAIRLMLARVMWLQGHVDTAMRDAAACLAEAQSLNNRFSISEVLRLASCPIALTSGDLAAAGRVITLMIDIATRDNTTFWKNAGQCFHARLLMAGGDVESGLSQLQAAMAESEHTGWRICFPEYFAAVAEGLASLKRSDEALEAVNKALATADATGEGWHLPEALRIKGNILLERGDKREAEECFVRAIDTARRQTAFLWELRATASLARLEAAQNRRDEAIARLASVCERAPEGRNAPDVTAARELLDSLRAG